MAKKKRQFAPQSMRDQILETFTCYDLDSLIEVLQELRDVDENSEQGDCDVDVSLITLRMRPSGGVYINLT